MEILVAFFGLARSLQYTIQSIEQNILTPLSSFGKVTILGHLYQQAEVFNPRSNEDVVLDQDLHKLIKFDSLLLEKPGLCLDRFDIQQIKRTHDPYKDGYRSITNLLHQLHSLNCVSNAISEHPQVDLVVFVRPDLCYQDSILSSVDRFLTAPRIDVMLPNWQSYGGYNDRFAICSASRYLSYGTRAKLVNRYVSAGNPLLSELFLLYVLTIEDLVVAKTSMRATRVRADGRNEVEDFGSDSAVANWISCRKLRFKYKLRQWLLDYNTSR